MKTTLINKERNEYSFELTEEETINRIYDCISVTNKDLRKSDIHRSKFSKEYVADFVNRYGEKVSISVGYGNLKRYFGSRLLVLNDETGGVIVRRVVPKKLLKSIEKEIN